MLKVLEIRVTSTVTTSANPDTIIRYYFFKPLVSALHKQTGGCIFCILKSGSHILHILHIILHILHIADNIQ